MSLCLEVGVEIICNRTLKTYYDKKRSEGKHHMTAVGAVARKLTYIVFAIMRDKEDYVPMI